MADDRDYMRSLAWSHHSDMRSDAPKGVDVAALRARYRAHAEMYARDADAVNADALMGVYDAAMTRCDTESGRPEDIAPTPVRRVVIAPPSHPPVLPTFLVMGACAMATAALLVAAMSPSAEDRAASRDELDGVFACQKLISTMAPMRIGDVGYPGSTKPLLGADGYQHLWREPRALCQASHGRVIGLIIDGRRVR